MKKKEKEKDKINDYNCNMYALIKKAIIRSL